MDEDNDYLEIGTLRRGQVLVCHGDDRPDFFASWLAPLAAEFDRLWLVALTSGIAPDPQDGEGPLEDMTAFCQRMGIRFEAEAWDGGMISGTYRWGWLPHGTVRATRARGCKLLEGLLAQLVGRPTAEPQAPRR